MDERTDGASRGFPVHEAVEEACKHAATLSRFKIHGMDRMFVPEPAAPTATVSFIEVNDRTYAVTAHHVINILDGKAKDEGRVHEGFHCPQAPGVAILGPFLKAPANYPHEPDVAICPVDARLPDHIGKVAFRVRQEDDAEWPVSHAVAIGFPTKAKRQLVNGRHEIRVALPCVRVLAEGIGSDGVAADLVRFHSALCAPPAVDDLSGMSGGLVLWTDGARYGLAGFVVGGDLIAPEGGSDLASPEWGVHLVVQPVDYGTMSKWTADVEKNWTRARKEMVEELEQASGRRPKVDRGEASLFEAHSEAVAGGLGLASNPMIEFLGRQFKDLDEAMDDEFLEKQRTETLSLLRQPNMALDGTKSEQLLRLVGESHFYVLCRNRGVDLEPVGEGTKTEFRIDGEDPVHLFVITPSYVGGAKAVEAIVEESRRLAEQERKVSEQVIAPFGLCAHERRLTHMIERLQEKILEAGDVGAMPGRATFLVCSLLGLPPYASSDSILRPVYCRHVDGEGVHAVTGELWMTTFSQPGMLVHSEPEFEGKPGVEGRVATTGILKQPEFRHIAGILFVVYDFEAQTKTLGLLHGEAEITETMASLVDAWNDEEDSNGWCLEPPGRAEQGRKGSGTGRTGP